MARCVEHERGWCTSADEVKVEEVAGKAVGCEGMENEGSESKK